PVIAVTGTNGKTTVTGLIADMLVASGVDAVAAGNIGTALSTVALDPPALTVVEASSFQLRFIDSFSPSVAVVVNIAPDHLDWHGTFDAYVAAKARIFENQGPEDVVVVDADDAVASDLARQAPGRTIRVSGDRVTEDGAGFDGDIVVGELRMLSPDVGASFLLDLAVASVAALESGATPAGVAGVIAGFSTGPHRRRLVGEWAGVQWVDDSKATNPHAAIAAVSSYPSVVLIAGGRNKGLDLEPLVTAPSVKAVIALGEAAEEIMALTPSRRAATIDEAVAIADEIAVAGDTVLLAPGCASFDMFDNYAARGDAFVTAVRSTKEDSSWPAA
ncbi:MAG: UDP-N-acetylmuramoyl-L-alanine--D-glutamate ligase, partial [Acidimicrobiia bacterium]|nr:UDP-N-acetylmuramoyl-L-alanine--D-glutamate ligase [Acidimicrobiia bacterium]